MVTVAVVGAGMIGRAWAIVFARAGHPVRLWDGVPSVAEDALAVISARVTELAEAGLSAPSDEVLPRIQAVSTLEQAVTGAGYVQENLPEEVSLKRQVFGELDLLAPAEAILASSTSAIPASAFTEELTGRHRCLVAHPANPPYLIPMVEVCPAPWTAPEVTARAREFLTEAGQVPVLVRKEIPGFILNRIQGALLNEAFRLVGEGYVSAEDLDKTVAHGLGLRWSFIGPFATIDLNAPGGVADYCARYGPFYERLASDPPPAGMWSGELAEGLNRRAREHCSLEDHPSRQAWRDRRLMALAAHKQAMENSEGGEPNA
jgi:3-hydroxyacyl-CoA dehydrogenase